MKISRIEIHRLQVPMKPDAVSSREYDTDGNASFTISLVKHILKVHTDDGLVGLGETWKGTPDAAVSAAARALLGVDPTMVSLTHLCRRLPHDPHIINVRDKGEVVAVPVPSIEHNPSIHAFETALADLQGKAWGIPVHQVLGGAVRDRVLVHYWSGRRTPEDLARVARAAQLQGFTGLKIKCTLEDPNVERVLAVTEACGPQFMITLDPNMRFHSVADTLALARQLEGCPIEVLEDPIPKDDLSLYVRLRQEMDIPVGLHLERPQDVLQAITLGAADIFNLRGTMTGFRGAAYLAEIAGLPVWRGSGLDLGILDASYTHVCATTPACSLGSDIVGNFLREDDLIVDPLVYENGHVRVPEGPGLGVELDEDALQRYAVNEGENGGPGRWEEKLP
ncbi:MAG: mandelate racemase/muconate lactonizing enzyme family protein [bacterium]|nr:mandelate racemase/muconate lactonizing enzyme family protein [bacterium]